MTTATFFLFQATEKKMEDFRQKLQDTNNELSDMRDRLANLTMELREKELVISNKEREIITLKQTIHQSENTDIVKNTNYDDENSINKLALKVSRFISF